MRFALELGCILGAPNRLGVSQVQCRQGIRSKPHPRVAQTEKVWPVLKNSGFLLSTVLSRVFNGPGRFRTFSRGEMHGAAFLRKHGENAGYRFSPGRSLRLYSALADRCPCGFPEVFPKYLHPQILSLEVVLLKGAGQSLMVAQSGRKTLIFRRFLDSKRRRHSLRRHGMVFFDNCFTGNYPEIEYLHA